MAPTLPSIATKNGLLIEDYEMGEQDPDAGIFLVPANDVGLSRCGQQCRDNLRQHLAILFFALMLSRCQQHKQKRLTGTLGPLALNGDHSLERFFA